MQSLILPALTLANSGAGFLLQVLIARLYGVGLETDAYFGALASPIFCVGLFGAQSTFHAVPALMLRGTEGDSAWLAAARSYMGTSAVLGCTLLAAGGVLWPAAAAGLGGRSPLSGLTPISLACWAFGATQFALIATSTVLQSRFHYAAAIALLGVPQLAACAALLVLRLPPIAVVPAIQAVVGAVLALGAAIVLLRSSGAQPAERRLARGFGLGIVLEAPRSAATLACFSLYAPLDSWLLPTYGPGLLTSAALCQRLIQAPGQLAIVTPLTLVTRDLVAGVERKDPDAFHRVLRATLSSVIVRALLLALAMLVLGDQIMRFITHRRSGGQFDPGLATAMLRQMLPGMVFMLASNILVRSALCIPGMVRRTWWLGGAWGLLYAGVLVALSGPGISGSGYAYSISWALSAVLFALFLKRTARPAIAGGALVSSGRE